MNALIFMMFPVQIICTKNRNMERERIVMKKFKSILSVMLAGTMLAGFTACGSSTGNQSSASSSTDNSTSAASNPTSSGDSIKVGILHSQSGTMASTNSRYCSTISIAISFFSFVITRPMS